MTQDKGIALLSCAALAGALAATGCVAEIESPTPPAARTGDLKVLWTINNTVNPGACFVHGGGPTDFELLVYQATRQIAEEYARCEDFGITVELPVGRYTAYATLVDPNRRPLTLSLPLESVNIVRNTTLTIDIDFPSGSFL